MKELKFTIPGPPVAKGRARAFKTKAGSIGHYTPEKTANYENLVALCAIKAMQEQKISMFTGPVKMSLFITCLIPKSWPKKKQQQAANDEIFPTGKPDCSNIAKSIEDAMNKIVYLDDSQIVDLSVYKTYCDETSVDVIITNVLDEYDDYMGDTR